MKTKIGLWLAAVLIFVLEIVCQAAMAAATPQIVLQLGLDQPASCAAMSPNGAYIATISSEDRDAVLWDASTGAILAHLDVPAGFYTIAFTPDSHTLALGDSLNGITLWDTSTGTLRRNLRVPGVKGQVENLQFDHSGKYLLASVADGQVSLFSMAATKPLYSWNVNIQGHIARARSAELSPDGRHVLTLTAQDMLPDTGRNNGHSDVQSAALQMHDARTGALLWQKALVNPSLFFSAKFVPSSTAILLLAGTSASICRSSDGRTMNRWSFKQEMMNASLSPDGKSAAITGIGAGDIFSIPDGHLGKPLPNTSGNGGAYYSPDGKEILATDDEAGDVQILSSQTLSLLKTLPGFHRPIIDSLAASPDGRTYAIVADYLSREAATSLLLLFDAATGTLIRQIELPASETSSLTYSPDSLKLSCQVEGKLLLFDVASGNQLFDIKGEDISLSPIRFSVDGRYLLTSDSQGSIFFRSPITGSVIKTLAVGHDVEVPAFALAPDGETLAVNVVRKEKDNISGGVEIWDVARQIRIKSLFSTQNPTVLTQLLHYPLLFSPDGKTLVVGNVYATGRKPARQKPAVLPTSQGFGLYTLPAGSQRSVVRDPAEQVAFSPDGSLLFTSYPMAWNVSTGKMVWQTMPQSAPDDAIAVGATDHDEIRLITTDRVNSGKITIWDSQTGREKAAIILLPLNAGQSGPAAQWLTVTQNGYYCGSSDASRWIRWRSGTSLLPASAFAGQRDQPTLVQQALN